MAICILFVSYWVCFMSPPDGHSRCPQHLSRTHTETAFVDGSCSACENMTMATLHSQLSFFLKRLRVTSGVSCPSPSSLGYKALTMFSECELGDAG